MTTNPFPAGSDTVWKKNWFDATEEIDKLNKTKRNGMIRTYMTKLRDSQVHDILELIYIFRIKALMLLFFDDTTVRCTEWKRFIENGYDTHQGWFDYRTHEHDTIISGYKETVDLIKKGKIVDARKTFTQHDKLFGALRHKNYLLSLSDR